MEKLRILVVEDDKLAQKAMAKHLGSHDVTLAGDLAAASHALDAGGFDICFIDLRLGEDDHECSGLKVIPRAAKKGIYPVVMSSSESEEVVTQAYALGCKDFYAKGNEEANVGEVIAKYRQSKTGFNADFVFTRQFVTEDPATRASIVEAAKYAPSDLPILILGPSGTGKTSLGQLIHEHSRRAGAFVAINCSAYTEELLEAELFGYRKGAFTGAADSRKGKLLQAHKGTLFLDEIGSMSLNMQTKLLKAIEERSFYPVGSDQPESSEFRIISATLEDLQKLIAQGRLRFDFFQRIHGFTVNLKPLYQRKCDILPLVRFFTRGGKRLSFAPEAKACLLEHAWPGNTRELKKFVELLAAGVEGHVTLEQVRRHLAQDSGRPSADGVCVDDVWYRYALDHGLPETVDRFIGEVIRRNLAENHGKKIKTLSSLKISNRLLYSTLKKQGT
ncbi:MAG: sigma-54-dependent Fis family transcriptional regulator [Elusimicrobia bacterium]|nr:sigma-54-dependent Fis family transcriptional regulator [Elusimicrobiota bacterium]